MAAKKKSQPRPVISEPSVLVCHEKHGERYFLVNDDEDLFRVALSILKGRFSQKEWYWFGELGPAPKPPGFTDDDVKRLPAALRADAFKKLVDYQKDLRRHEDDAERLAEVKAAADGTGGRLAWEVLRDNSDGEYARISLNRLSKKYEV